MNKEAIFQSTRALAKAKSEEAQTKAIQKFCDRADIEFFSFSSVYHSAYNQPPKKALIDGFPAPWRKSYEENNYAEHDMVADHCRQNFTPIQWVKETAQLDEINAEMFSEAAEHGIVSGMSCPYHGVNGEYAVFNVAVDSTFKKSALNRITTQHGVYLLGATLFDSLRKNRKIQEKDKLNLREIACLRFASEGLNSKQIAKMLGLTERTVVFHFENARKKLNATTRTEAVSRAIMLSLL